MSKAPRPEAPTFQEIILRLQRYWHTTASFVINHNANK